MRKLIFMAAMFAFVLTASAWAADISGKWTLTWWGAGAEESFPMVIKAAGENLTITGTHPGFGELTGTGTLKGDSVSMTLKSSSMEIALTGKVSGNKMEGIREIKGAGVGRDGGPGGAAPEGAPSGGPGDAPQQGGTPPQGGMPDGAGGPQGGGPGGAPGSAPPEGGMPGGTGGAQAGAPQGGQGSDAAGGNENWTAVRN